MKGSIALAALTIGVAMQLLAGCSLPVSNTCNTTADCLTGQCVAGVCQVIPKSDADADADASAPEVSPNASEAGVLDRTDAPPDLSVDASSPDFPPEAPDAPSDAGPDERSERSTDAAEDTPPDAPPDTRLTFPDAGPSDTLSPCPAWADWPMPSPPSLTGVPDDPQRNLPNPQIYDTSTPDVVTDNVTHLLWQRGISPNLLTWSQATSYCAGLNLAGRTDWRLPSRIELVSLVDFTEPLLNLNSDAFPGSTRDHFWTCSSGPGNPLVAWDVDFGVAGSTLDDKSTQEFRVRCVSGARAATPPPTRYDTATIPGEVRDLKTLLTWRPNIGPGAMTWGQAYSYCQGLGSTWRLPSLMELQTLIDENQATSAVDPTAFPDRPDEYYWTSSFFNVTLNTTWFVSIGSGNTYWLPSTNLAMARCVR